jgi:hypothetical protein
MSKRPADKPDGDSIASKISKSNIEETSEKAVTASLKTVKKWQKELNVDLDIVMGDSSTVTQMACKTCKMFAPADSVSKVFIFNYIFCLFINQNGKIICSYKYGLVPFCPFCLSCNVQSFIWSREWVGGAIKTA